MTRRGTLRYVCLALALGLTALALAALACGPSAPSGQDDSAPTLTATDLPTFTPFPAVVWRTDEAPAQQGTGAHATSSSALVEELREFMAKVNFDAVARVRVRDYQDVLIPQRNGAEPMQHRRHTLAVISTYQGALPSSIAISLGPLDYPNFQVSEDQEYIMFLTKFLVLEGEYPYDKRRFGFTQAELDSMRRFRYSRIWYHC